MRIFYAQLAPWWPLVSPVEDYEEEAREIARVIAAHAPRARTLLELGSGGGHIAFYLKRALALTLTDLSPEMLAMSARLNPECEHVPGDMRSLDLGRTFDVVFAHDAIDYMTTEDDLAAAIETASRHLGPGGVAVFMPDHIAERYAPSTDHGGADGPDGRALRFLEWTTEVAPGATSGTTHYSFLVREADGSVRALHEAHAFGLFSQATWTRLFERAGFAVDAVEEVTNDDRAPRVLFIGRKR
ncbi:MAG: methyltransferase domain-containing protein [Kofleriaceae bacterium]|nr:methyltransferase domain-containing protein [Kofleriaceae bacterium]